MSAPPHTGKGSKSLRGSLVGAWGPAGRVGGEDAWRPVRRGLRRRPAAAPLPARGAPSPGRGPSASPGENGVQRLHCGVIETRRPERGGRGPLIGGRS